MTILSTRTPGSPENSPPVRLDSWKEIASYLGKAERTVKRWETEHALPVHRPPGNRGSVYAFAWELDQWLKLTRDTKELSAAIPSSLTKSPADVISSTPLTPQSKSLASSLNPVPTPATVMQPRKGLGWTWRIPILIVLPVCIIVAAALAVQRHTADANTPSSATSLQPAKRSPVLVTSDAEKRKAHELYLQGRFEWNKRTADSLNRAVDLFTQAIVHDPSNAQNYAGLSETYVLLHEYSLVPNNEACVRALAAAKKAVELDDGLAEAHRALAFAEVWGNWDFKDGEREFLRAIELNPHDPLVHLWFAIAFFETPNWFPVSLHELDRAQELDPTSPVILINKSMCLFEIGQKEAGLELARQVERTNPDFLAPHRYLAQMHWNLRGYPAFLNESERLVELNHDPVLAQTTAAAKEGFRRAGEPGLLHDLYVVQKKLHAEGKLAGAPLARICIRLGKKEEAVQLLREDYNGHRPEFLWFLSDLDLRSLNDEPVYQDFVGKLNFPFPPTIAAMDAAVQSSISSHDLPSKHP